MPTSGNPSAKRPCARGQGWLMRCRVARPRPPSCRKTARAKRPLAYKPIPTPLYRPLAARRRRSTARNNTKNANGLLLRPRPLWQVHPLAPWVTLAPVPVAPPEPEPPLLTADPLLPPVTMPPPPPAAAPPAPPPRPPVPARSLDHHRRRRGTPRISNVDETKPSCLAGTWPPKFYLAVNEATIAK